MGSSQSYPGLTQDVLEDYTSLTYLSKGEILYLMKKFYSIDPVKLEADPNHRFYMDDIMAKFDAIKNNPFKDRIFRVFSSKGDDCFSFEDLLDLSSVMSPECPPEVKAEWAFRIFDIDDDKQISEKDICEILDRLTSADVNKCLDQPSKEEIAKVIIKEMNLWGYSQPSETALSKSVRKLFECHLHELFTNPTSETFDSVIRNEGFIYRIRIRQLIGVGIFSERKKKLK